MSTIDEYLANALDDVKGVSWMYIESSGVAVTTCLVHIHHGDDMIEVTGLGLGDREGVVAGMIEDDPDIPISVVRDYARYMVPWLDACIVVEWDDIEDWDDVSDVLGDYATVSLRPSRIESDIYRPSDLADDPL